MSETMNDSCEVIYDNHSNGANSRLCKFGNFYYIETSFFTTEIYTGNKEFSTNQIFTDWIEAFDTYFRYLYGLSIGLDVPEAVLRFPWMYEEGEPEDVDEEQNFLDFCLENFELAPHIQCPHCEKRFFDKDVIYKMMRAMNPHLDLCTLVCPECKEEIKTYGYHKYYKILEAKP